MTSGGDALVAFLDSGTGTAPSGRSVADIVRELEGHIGKVHRRRPWLLEPYEPPWVTAERLEAAR